MAHWSVGTVTNEGVEMLNEWMAGRFITITGAYGGTGTVPEEELAELTDLVNPKQDCSIIKETDSSKGKTLQVQVLNTDVMEEYELNQIGIKAKLDDEEEEKLLLVIQDEKGITVPASMDGTYMLDVFVVLAVTNTGRLVVTVDAAGIATIIYVSEAIEEALDAHNADEGAHPSICTNVEQIASQTNEVESTVAEMNSRLVLLELMLRTQVTGNPFTVTFDKLDGAKVTGVWNATQKRIEF